MTSPCLLAQVVDEIYPSLSAKGNSAAFTVDDDLTDAFTIYARAYFEFVAFGTVTND